MSRITGRKIFRCNQTRETHLLTKNITAKVQELDSDKFQECMFRVHVISTRYLKCLVLLFDAGGEKGKIGMSCVCELI
jgi:hypothetical protein